MKNSPAGTERPRAFVVELGTSWKRWAKHRSDSELEQINSRLKELCEGFGKPHEHVGLGVRPLGKSFFEFRISRDLRVIFLFIRPKTFRLMMTGNHDEVRAWLKENK
ncbi:MAG: hypothetical protein ABIP71_00225 [Verrucomicrobiota bacterium]